MKIRIQRIARSDGYKRHSIDSKLMEGTIKSIRIGYPMDIQFARLDEGRWVTTKITRIEFRTDKIRLIHTKNSMYVVIKGWEEPQDA